MTAVLFDLLRISTAGWGAAQYKIFDGIGERARMGRYGDI